MLLIFTIISSIFNIKLLDLYKTIRLDTAKYRFKALPLVEKASFRIRRRIKDSKLKLLEEERKYVNKYREFI